METGTLKLAVKRIVKSAIDGRLVYYKKPKVWGGDILLTFDDGPHPTFTPRILDLLDEFNAKALFFVIGSRAVGHETLLHQITSRGHAIGNHTFSHLNDFEERQYSLNCVKQEIEKCRSLVREYGAQTTTYFRPPRGELNYRTFRAAQITGHQLMHWSLEGGEWGRRSEWEASRISDFLIENLNVNDIVLLHDDNEKTIPILSKLLRESKRLGFDFASEIPS